MFIVINRVKIIIIILIFCLGLFGYIIYLNNSQAVPVTSRQKLVIIDPGHGGVDGGCSGSSGVLEKDLNLKVSLKLANLLNKAEIPYKMTRETDISVHDDNKKSIRSKKVSDLQNRRKMIEESGCSLFISIHMNQFEQSQYRGAQVFYSKVNPLSKDLADLAQKMILDEVQDGNKRKPKKAGNDVYLLKYTQMPAIFVECGFLSNPEEEKLLITDEYQEKLARALFNTIKIWYQDYSEKEINKPSGLTPEGLLYLFI